MIVYRAVMIDPLSATPAYVQVANVVAARIESGEIQPDRPVPSEHQLQQELGVSRGTVRRAMAVLRDRGLVATVHGRGTYVLPR